MARLRLFRDSPAPLETYIPARVTTGTPVTTYRVHATGEDGRLSAGVWHATPGAWEVSYTEWEYCHVLSGRARLHEAGRAPVEVGPGDGLTIEPGFTGVWEVLEAMTKEFVILDPPAPQ